MKAGQYIFEDSPLKTIKNQDVIVCIDPGPRNMGYCVYSLKEDKILELDVIELREAVSDDTTEMQRIALSVKGVRKFVLERYEEWAAQDAYFYIEDQIEGRRKGMYEPNAIQSAFYTLIGPDRAAIQLPHTVKTFFSDYYKMRDDAKSKYDSNKKNAEEYFLKLLPPKWLECVNALKKHRKKKLDDVADAFFMAQLVACIYRGEPSHSQLRNLEEKRKKKEARELKKAETAEKKLKEKQEKMQARERKKREKPSATRGRGKPKKRVAAADDPVVSISSDAPKKRGRKKKAKTEPDPEPEPELESFVESGEKKKEKEKDPEMQNGEDDDDGDEELPSLAKLLRECK